MCFAFFGKSSFGKVRVFYLTVNAMFELVIFSVLCTHIKL